MTTVAALFVLSGGPYFNLPHVDPWDEKRDARKYNGPHKVIAHPPCERWGRYWSGGPSAKTRRKLGDDGGCFESAIKSVRSFGGILEHPEASHAWKAFGLTNPPRGGGWIPAGDFVGWTCCVEQGWYGHPARKATWLYAVGIDLPQLKWGRAPGVFMRLDSGFHSKKERASATNISAARRLSAKQAKQTPIKFRDVLLGALLRQEAFK